MASRMATMGSGAKAARWCFRHGGLVFGLWLLLMMMGLAASVVLYQTPTQNALALDGAAQPVAGAFDRLDHLMVLHLRGGAGAASVGAARDDIVHALQNEDGPFDVVFSPGSGDYYDAYAMLYRPLDEVKARVAYALSLKPLFDAVAQSPDAASMATLTEAIAGSVTQGREAQGLDDLLGAAAQSTEALMNGQDKPIDWAKIATLTVDAEPQSAEIFALPKPGLEHEAQLLLDKVAHETQSAQGFEVEAKSGGGASQPQAKPQFDKLRWLTGLFVGLVLASLVLALGLGRFALVLFIALPGLLLAPVVMAGSLWVVGASWLSLWPLALLPLFAGGVIALDLLLAAATTGYPDHRALMLAADAHGARWLRQAALFAIPAAGLFLLPVAQSWGVAAIAVGSVVLAGLAGFSLPCALARLTGGGYRWPAQAWLQPAHRALFETAAWSYVARTLAGLGIAAALTVLAISTLTAPAIDAQSTVSVIAENESEARKILQFLAAVKEADSVQWLGGFLPVQGDEKLAALQPLKNQFPRIEPVAPGDPADLRDEIDKMQESLRTVATSASARPELRRASEYFRRSLALVAATSEDNEVMKLENRLYGGFNRLADTADELGALESPTLVGLPDGLKALFGAPPGPLRLEVSPQAGVTASALARRLANEGLGVLQPSGRSGADVTQALLRYAAFCAIAAALLLIMASGSIATGVESLLVGFAAAVVVAVIYSQSIGIWDLTVVLTLCAAGGFLLASLGQAPLDEPVTAHGALQLLLLPLVAVSFALPLLALGLWPASGPIMPFAASLIGAGLIAGLFRRHEMAAVDEDDSG